MTVFAVHPFVNETINLADAARFGTVQYVNERYVYSDEINDEMLPQYVQRRLWQAAKKFDYSADYLLIAGDHMQLTTFSAMLGAICPWFRVLRWERKVSAYMPVRITT